MAIDAEKIHKSVRKLRKVATKLSKEPSPEKVHKLRTTARKLEAIFSALSLDSQKNERRLVRKLRRIRKRAGKVRDLDVLTGDLATVHLEGETDCQVRLLEHLGGERQKQAGKLRNLIRDNRAKLKTRLRRASASFDQALQNTESHAASLAAAESLRLSSELELPKRLNKGNLHSYRLKIKQLRYVLQLAPGHPTFVDDLGEAKDAIGEWHDWEELIAIANEVLDHGSNCKLTRRLKETADSKFAHAHRVAENLRRTYLRSSSQSRKGPHRVELSQAAVAASTALSEDLPRVA
ncbi:MAG: CHAD domain-containing protein [Terriglobales bacterium]